MAQNVTQCCHVCKSQTTSGPPVIILAQTTQTAYETLYNVFILNLRESLGMQNISILPYSYSKWKQQYPPTKGYRA